MDLVGILNMLAALGGFGVILALIWFAIRGDPERGAEEAAREHFDRFGRWPDER